MATNYAQTPLHSWTKTVLAQPYAHEIPEPQVRKITSEKLLTIYGWTLADYLVTRTAIASAALNALAGITHVPSNYDPHQFMYPLLGAVTLGAAGLFTAALDANIGCSLQTIDYNIKMPTRSTIEKKVLQP